MRRGRSIHATGLVAVLALLALAGPAGSPAQDPKCTLTPASPAVSPGQEITITFKDCPARFSGTFSPVITDQPVGAVATIGTVTSTGNFTLVVRAGDGFGGRSVRIGIAWSPEPGTGGIEIGVSIIKSHKPNCAIPAPNTVLAGAGPLLRVRCDNAEVPKERPTLRIVSGPEHGRLRVYRWLRGWIYLPDVGFTGTERFSFQATNSYGASPPVVVELKVRAARPEEAGEVYVTRVCGEAPQFDTTCFPGGGRRYTGSRRYKTWPAITGVILYLSRRGGRMAGGARNDKLHGYRGSDTISGRGGRDVIFGGEAPGSSGRRQRDALRGGTGGDVIYTGNGHNRVSGGPGNDLVWAYQGRGAIECGPGVDKVFLNERRRSYTLRGCEQRGTF